jgi:hypothetical protein
MDGVSPLLSTNYYPSTSFVFSLFSVEVVLVLEEIERASRAMQYKYKRSAELSFGRSGSVGQDEGTK